MDMDKAKLEYIWLDGYEPTQNMRSKTMVRSEFGGTLEECPMWMFDGSSTKQAEGRDSEVLIKPQAIFSDPFHKAEESSGVEGSFLVMCDTYLPTMEPHPTNSRHSAQETFNKYAELESLFGIEQEFFITKNNKVLGFSGAPYTEPFSQGDYYCSIGASNSIGREFIEEAFENCLKAGLRLTGLNAEVAPSQWEFQVCDQGINVSDQLMMMRYILNRTAEKYGWEITFNPKPIKGEWNGSGCHTNFSTSIMRAEGGYEHILNAIELLRENHDYHMLQYGEGNEHRMTGKLETSNFMKFSSGIANRGCSIRIPTQTHADKKGYFEDRRPASNIDPYLVSSLIYQTSCL